MDEKEDGRGAADEGQAADVAEREADVTRREAALANRQEVADEVLAAADRRDAKADKRDDIAVENDRAADLVAFVAPKGGAYGQDNPGRRRAAMARLDAKDDRTSSAVDRQALTEDPAPDEVETPED